MVAEYAHAYGTPGPSLAWPTFRALVRRAGRFDARLRLSFLEAAQVAIRWALAGDETGEHEAERLRLKGLAYTGAPAEEILVQQRPAAVLVGPDGQPLR